MLIYANEALSNSVRTHFHTFPEEKSEYWTFDFYRGEIFGDLFLSLHQKMLKNTIFMLNYINHPNDI